MSVVQRGHGLLAVALGRRYGGYDGRLSAAAQGVLQNTSQLAFSAHMGKETRVMGGEATFTKGFYAVLWGRNGNINDIPNKGHPLCEGRLTIISQTLTVLHNF